MKKTLWFKSCIEFADEIEYELHYPTGKNEVIFTVAAVGEVCGGLRFFGGHPPLAEMLP
jgi:hypothetical protein